MSYIRIKDKFGRWIVIGTGKIILDKNGCDVTKTESGRYKLRTLGASVMSDKPDIHGVMRWRHDRLWVGCGSELAHVAESLSVGDRVFVYGVLGKEQTYFDADSGKRKKNAFCNAEYLQKIGHDSVTVQPTTVEEQQDDYEDDENDTFPDF